MKKLVFVKLSGDLIAPKEEKYKANSQVINEFSKQLKEVIKKFPDLYFVLGNGAGSFGHSPAVDYNLKSKIRSKKQIFGGGFVHRKVIELNTLVVRSLQNEGVSCFQFTPASFIFTKDYKIEKFLLEGIFKILDLKSIPIVFGDVLLDKNCGYSIISTEEILYLVLTESLKRGFFPFRAVFLGKYEGVYDENGKVIRKITFENYNAFKKSIEGTRKKDVTGGMKQKVELALKYADFGMEVNIAKFSLRENILLEILKGRNKGTVISKD